MRCMKVAIGITSGRIDTKRHAGDNPFFHVYEFCEDGSYKLLKEIENTAPEEKKHADEKKMKGVMSLLGDIDVIVGGLMSPNFLNMRDKTPIQPIVSKIETIEGFFAKLKEEFDHIYGLVEKRKNGERPKEIPTLKGE